MKKSIKINYIYNLSYQILLLIVPFITTPYLSRVLGADGIGIYSYNESIVSYFTLFATMGIAIYGRREISYVQDDKVCRSIVFWEAKILELITTLICFIIYLFFALSRDNSIFYLVFSFNILAVAADVTWFFQGIEEFGRIILRNVVFKIINIAYIFIIVREKNDLILYLLGTSIFIFLGNLSLWAHLPKYILIPDIRNLKPGRHIKIMLSLFIPTIAIQVYTVLDKTMLGIITNNPYENGYYEQAIRISKLILTVVTALGTVMIPRIGYYFEHHETKKLRDAMYRSYQFVWFLGIPLCLGLVGISPNFIPWFLGIGYESVEQLLGITSFLILAIGINNITGMQFLIPTKRQNIFTFTVILGAIINFTLNLVLIPKFQAMGAAVATVIAESVIAVAQLVIVRKELSVLKILSLGKSYFLAGIVMFFCVRYVGIMLIPSLMNSLGLVVIGSVIYIGVLLVLKDEFLFSNFNIVFEKIRNIPK